MTPQERLDNATLTLKQAERELDEAARPLVEKVQKAAAEVKAARALLRKAVQGE